MAISGIGFDVNNSSPTLIFSNNNLTAQGTDTVGFPYWYGAISIVSHSTGKKYFEVTQTVYAYYGLMVGLVTGPNALGGPNTNYIGYDTEGWSFEFSELDSSWLYHNASVISPTSTGEPLTSNGDVVGVAVDFDEGKIWFSKNGTWIFGGDPAVGNDPSFTFTPNTELFGAICLRLNEAIGTVNFGNASFNFAIPDGFSAWDSSQPIPEVSSYVSAQEIIYKSFRLLGVITSGQAPTAIELKDSLYTLNSLIDSFSSNPEYYYYTDDETKVLTPTVNTYTIGTNADINTTRPIRVVGAFVRNNTTGIDSSIGLITEQLWNNIPNKSATGTPAKLLYRPTSPSGKILLYPVPAGGEESLLTLHLRLEKTLVRYPSLTSTQYLPPGYQRLLELSLAMDQAPEYASKVAPETIEFLKQSLADIIRINFQKLPSSKPGPFPPSNVYMSDPTAQSV